MTPARKPRHGAGIVMLWLALMVAGALAIARANYSADLSAFLPASPNAAQRLLIEQLRSGVASRTVMLGIEGGDAAQRADASRQLASRLRQTGLFDQVVNGDNDQAESDASGWRAAGTWIFDHRYLLSPAVTPQRFTANGLRDAIDDTLSLLGTPAGASIKPLIDRDPTGETARIAEALIPSSAPRSEAGVWVSRDAPRAVLLATTKAAGADLDAQAQALAAVDAAFAASAAPELKLLRGGQPVFAVQSRSQIEREATRLAIAGALLMGALLGAVFASPRAVLIALLPVASGIVGGIAAVALAFGTVHGLTLGFGSTLIGESVDYAIYYLIQARGAAAEPGWKRWRRQSWPTVRLGLLTSLCGFAALVFSGFPGLAQLGVFSIAGLAAAAATTRFVLPVIAPDGAAGRGLRGALSRVAAQATSTLPRWRMPLAALALAALALVVWRHAAVWRGDLASLSPIPAQAQAIDAALRRDLGASDARTLVVIEAGDEETALRQTEAAGERLDALVAAGQLGGYDTPTRLLPSLQTQRVRQASLPDAPTLRRSLADATTGGALPAARLEPFIAAVSAARALTPVQYESLPAGALRLAVDALLLDHRDGHWAPLLALKAPMHDGHSADIDIDIDAVRQALADLSGARVLDLKATLDGLYAKYLGEALLQAGLGALAVLVLLAAWLRSRQRLWRVCQPLALAVVLTLGLLVACDVALGILHLVGLLLVVAVGSNYALFFDHWQHDGSADPDQLASLALANLTTVLSFGVIALSGIPALSAIGRVVAPGALLALILSAAFVRVLPRSLG